MSESRKLEFENAEGQRLAASLETPGGAPRAYAVFAHCFTCSKDALAASRVSRALRDRGYAVLRFDFTGLGTSEGDFANTNFASNVEDLVAAAGFLARAHEAPRVLIGHSLGGTAVLAAAARIPAAVAVATIGSPASPAHVKRHLVDQAETITREGCATVNLAGRPFLIKKQFLEDLELHPLEERLGELDKALMIFHAPDDRIVNVDEARKIFEAARHPKSFVSLDGADHLLTRREDSEFVAEMLAAWAARYLPG